MFTIPLALVNRYSCPGQCVVLSVKRSVQTLELWNNPFCLGVDL